MNTDDYVPLSDAFAEAYRVIRRAQRAGLPVPAIRDLLAKYEQDRLASPEDLEAPRVPVLRLVWSRD